MQCEKVWLTTSVLKILGDDPGHGWIGSVLSSCFYAEPFLASSETHTYGVYIRCRIPPGSHLLNLMQRFRQWKTPIFYRVGRRSWLREILCDSETWEALKSGQEYRRRLDMGAPAFGLQIQVRIETTPAGGGLYDISSSPFTVADLLQKQDFFGAMTGLSFEDGTPEEIPVAVKDSASQGGLAAEMEKLKMLLESMLI
ncbi:hypothetical protein BBAD15_g6696 [Beauveria bassiana D1-5]|uniref:Uncharacterized protein n=1 Tax=Beauveria bassiana D1-5 TaxID=1245745 RepID=A0A0A2VK19_BEABA|nr:hypothetical protein BBAD15_g6696 [Beauveria bassiana D1-5]